MKIISESLLILLCISIFVSSCTREYDLPELTPETTRINTNSEQIPEVTSALLRQMGLDNAEGRFSVNSDYSTDFKINWNRIKQLVNEDGKRTYTFGIEDLDNDPSTFYNLVFQLSPENDPYKPYVLKYIMNEDFAQAYHSGQENFDSFRGRVQKITINPVSFQQRGVFSDDSESGNQVVSGTPCPDDTDVGNQNSGGSSGSSGGSNNNLPDDDAYVSCDVSVIPTDWYNCVSVNGGIQECTYDETTYELVYENCGLVSAMSAYTGGDDTCTKKDDEIPILEPETNSTPPDCASFEYTKTTIDAYWQEAGVMNFRFSLAVLDGTKVRVVPISFPEPIVFGMPTQYATGVVIESGEAAQISANFLALAIHNIGRRYARTNTSVMTIRTEFQKEVKRLFEGLGGRATFNYSGTNPLIRFNQYKTRLFSTGNCD